MFRQRMVVNHFSPRTIRSYSAAVKRLYAFHDTPLASLSDDKLVSFICSLKEDNELSAASMRIAVGAIKYFYRHILDRAALVEKIPYPKKEKHIKVILAGKEVKQLLDLTQNLKHRLILKVLYSTGLIELQNQGVIKMEVDLIPGRKYLHPLYNKKWVVYAKKPLPTSDKVVEYIGRYSHRVAISNHRIKQVQDGKVTFSWIDYRTSKEGLMPLDASDFLQRFFSHVLPPGFMKIRHYGILSSRNKAACIARVREQFNVAPAPAPVKELNWMETFEMLYGRHPKLCPCCGKGVLLAVETFLPKHLVRIRNDPNIPPNWLFSKQQQ